MSSIIYGIASALSWGAGDFAGGLASRKMSAYRAVFYADFLGVLVLITVWLFLRDPFPERSVVINAVLGGALGTVGLMALYYSRSIGLMSLAAPTTAVFAAVLPVVVSLVTEGLPSWFQLIGFGLALAAVWMFSNTGEGFHVNRFSDLTIPIIAGIGFGGYFIFIDQASSVSSSTLWILILSRTAGTFFAIGVLLIRRESFAVPREAWGVMLLNALFDVGGNFFYTLATRTGRLDISAILSSLYPGSTVILAWWLLKERITARQWLGIAFALTAIIFLAQ